MLRKRRAPFRRDIVTWVIHSIMSLKKYSAFSCIFHGFHLIYTLQSRILRGHRVCFLHFASCTVFISAVSTDFKIVYNAKK